MTAKTGCLPLHMYYEHCKQLFIFPVYEHCKQLIFVSPVYEYCKAFFCLPGYEYCKQIFVFPMYVCCKQLFVFSVYEYCMRTAFLSYQCNYLNIRETASQIVKYFVQLHQRHEETAADAQTGEKYSIIAINEKCLR